MLQDNSHFDAESARRQMVEQQIRTEDVTEQKLLQAVTALPREHFVPSAYRQLAYADTEIPLGMGECMMRPAIEGRLLQALELEAEDEVLEIGTGSGYLTACLARLARHVVSIDLHAAFIERATKRLAELAIDNVTLYRQDMVQDGLPAGPFDAIAVTGSMPVFDPRLVACLKPGGRLFVIVGQDPVMEARLVTRGADDDWQSRSLFETSLPRLQNVELPSGFDF